MCVCVPHLCLVPVEYRRGLQILWNWSYSCLMGSNLSRASSALNHQAISPDAKPLFLVDSCFL